MGISVDETTHNLLRKHGGRRRVGALIGKLIRQFDQDDSIGLQTIHEQLDWIINLIEEGKENKMSK
jgi:ribosomal 50S subunit-associated protein YjgA (DUF615 family)